MPDPSQAGLFGIDPQLLMNLGNGLMSAAKPYGNLGDSLTAAVQNYQLQKARTQQFQTGQLDLARQRMLMGAAMQEFGNQGQGAPPPAAGLMGGAATQVGGMPTGSAPVPPQGPQAQPQGPPGAPQLAPQNAGVGPPQDAGAAPSWLTPPNENQIYSQPVGGISPGYLRGTALLSGRSPLPDLNSLREQQLKLAQQQYATVIGKMDTLTKSDNPTQYMQADPDLKSAWPILAQRLGYDPIKGLTAPNIRTAFTFARNNLASALSEPTVAPPVQKTIEAGPYGSVYETDPVTNSTTQVTGRSMPEYTGTDVYDSATGKTTRKYQQTGGWFGGSGVPNIAPPRIPAAPTAAPSATPMVTAASGTPSKAGPKDVDLGMGKPDTESLKDAGYAQYFRTGTSGVAKIEAGGYLLPPLARGLVINAATSDADGITQQVVSQYLLRNGLDLGHNKQAQEYLASLMPMLQAAGHSMAGARLTTGQMRTNFESIIPITKDSLPQVTENRNSFYTGLLARSGAARDNPLYKNTLGADFATMSANGVRPPAWMTGQQANAAVHPPAIQALIAKYAKAQAAAQ